MVHNSPIPVNASPTKQFFVKMLTRDIELLDAILDLLDNCIDGIIRSKPTRGAKTPYQGFYAHIIANENQFSIEDNCGGIPRNLAEKVAFRLGRPTDEELAASGIGLGKKGTVGLYGIGMKRAIFKMGTEASVTTENNGEAFRVDFTPEWMESGNWKLEMVPTKVSSIEGTRIAVTKLRVEIVDKFANGSAFLSTLSTSISQLFAVIIKKGFSITLNGDTISAVTLSLLYSDKSNGTDSINPYVFKGTISKVVIEVVVGFFREPYKAAADADEDTDDSRSDVKQAGWSIVCNDRLVLYGDKSINTGWGSKAVPRFHNQYNAIAGIVTLKSDDPEHLPFNTTKHGIELGFGVYIKVLEYMKEGVRRFVDYTNNWKGRLNDTKPQFVNAKPVEATEIPKLIEAESFTKISSKKLADDESAAEEFKPTLAAPPKTSTTKQIRFTKPISEIEEVAQSLFSDKSIAPNVVGEKCFDQALSNSRKAKRKS